MANISWFVITILSFILAATLMAIYLIADRSRQLKKMEYLLNQGQRRYEWTTGMTEQSKSRAGLEPWLEAIILIGILLLIILGFVGLGHLLHPNQN